MEPFIPAIVDAIHQAFSIATASTFVIGIVGTVIAAGLVLLFRDAPAVAAEAEAEERAASEGTRRRLTRGRQESTVPGRRETPRHIRVSNGVGYWAIFSRPIEAPCGSVTMANSPPGKSCGSNTVLRPELGRLLVRRLDVRRR